MSTETARNLIWSYARGAGVTIARMPSSEIHALSVTGGQICPVYDRWLDKVWIPEDREETATTARTFSAIFHELAHSTGAASRLARFATYQGDQAAARPAEEVAAEFASLMLCHHTGVDDADTRKRSIRYIAGWAVALRDDAVVGECTRNGARAADYIIEIAEKNGWEHK